MRSSLAKEICTCYTVGIQKRTAIGPSVKRHLVAFYGCVDSCPKWHAGWEICLLRGLYD